MSSPAESEHSWAEFTNFAPIPPGCPDGLLTLLWCVLPCVGYLLTAALVPEEGRTHFIEIPLPGATVSIVIVIAHELNQLGLSCLAGGWAGLH